ncbi:MAG: caspase family protein, partial [Acidobacteriota bacterium]|nr:caspase family protein [Acidobacteriota bacterium]
AMLAAAGGDDNTTIKLYNLADGQARLTLRGHTAEINSVAFHPDGNILASASHDGSTLLWDTRTGEQLATLISIGDGRDWLVVTPDSLFDGSPAAWNQILWRYDRDIFNVAPIEWFFNEFFYPDLLADLLRGQRPRAPRDFAQLDRHPPKLALTLVNPAPIANPSSPANAGVSAPVTTREITVKIDIKEAPTGARDLRLFRNGSLVKVWRGDVLNGPAPQTLEATLPIIAGENRLTAYAFNKDNVKSADATLRVQGAENLRRKGTAYVLAIGVNAYSNSQYDLRYAVADARSFGEEIQRQQTQLGFYERTELVALYDKDATKAQILAALETLAAKTQPEDLLAVYFAGHGTAQQNQFFLLPHDLGYAGDRTRLDAQGLQAILSHSISDTELETAFERVGAGQLLFVIDACNSGQALEAEEKRRGPMNSKGLAQLAYEKGMFILTASQSYQAAQEASQLGHGLLTYALVEEGLKGAAADSEPKDGTVLAREWFDYAEGRVPTIQIEKLKQARSAGLDLSFVESEQPPQQRGLDTVRRITQRPRVFYRRELETRPVIIAKTK